MGIGSNFVGSRSWPKTISQKSKEGLYNAILEHKPELEPTAKTQSIDKIIVRCLEKSPNERFASANDLSERLDAWLRINYSSGLNKWRYGWRRNVGLIAAFSFLFLGHLDVSIHSRAEPS